MMTQPMLEVKSWNPERDKMAMPYIEDVADINLTLGQEFLKLDSDARTSDFIASAASKALRALGYDTPTDTFRGKDQRILDTLNGELVPYMNTAFAASADESLNQSFRSSNHATWHDWVFETDEMDNYTKLLERNRDRLNALSKTPEVSEAVSEAKLTYKRQVTRAAIAGNLHIEAMTAALAVADVPVGFHDITGAGPSGMYGYVIRDEKHHLSGNVVVVEHGDSDAARLARRVTKIGNHEFNHAVMGNFGDEWLNEAVTEHIAHALAHGTWDTTTPVSNIHGFYEEYRSMLQHVLRSGQRDIPMQLVALAYSARSEIAKRIAIADLNDALSTAYGKPIDFADISETIQKQFDSGMQVDEMQDQWTLRHGVCDDDELADKRIDDALAYAQEKYLANLRLETSAIEATPNVDL